MPNLYNINVIIIVDLLINWKLHLILIKKTIEVREKFSNISYTNYRNIYVFGEGPFVVRASRPQPTKLALEYGPGVGVLRLVAALSFAIFSADFESPEKFVF